MDYDYIIIHLLFEAGSDGLSIRKLCRHVYNEELELFNSTTIDEIHRKVCRFIRSRSKGSKAILESTGKRGSYRLRRDCRYLYKINCESQNKKRDVTTLSEESGSHSPETQLSLFDE